jgi:hypothetical protein
VKTVHRAALCNESGDVTSRCAPMRVVNLKRATWTIRDEAVTCARCLAWMAAHRRAA